MTARRATSGRPGSAPESRLTKDRTFDNVDEHIADLGDTYRAKIAVPLSATGLTPKGFAVGTGGGA